MDDPAKILLEKGMDIENQMQADAVTKEILDIINSLDRKDISDWSPDDLSRAAMKLSVLLVNLGQTVSRAMLKSNASYAYRKFKFATEYKKLRKVLDRIKDSEVEAQDAISREVQDEIEAQAEADTFKTLYDDVDRLVMVIQSRLKQLNSERTKSNLQT